MKSSHLRPNHEKSKNNNHNFNKITKQINQQNYLVRGSFINLIQLIGIHFTLPLAKVKKKKKYNNKSYQWLKQTLLSNYNS